MLNNRDYSHHVEISNPQFFRVVNMSKDEVRNKESIDERSDGKEESSIGEGDYLNVMCRGRRV